MRIAIIGAGLVGVSTAWELASDGHEVEVYDRHDGVAAEGSFAPAGLLAAAGLLPGAWPGLPGTYPPPPEGSDAPFQPPVRPEADTQAWLGAWQRAGENEGRASLDELSDLLGYARERLLGFFESSGISIERSSGALVLLGDEEDLRAARPWLRSLAERQQRFALVDAAQCRQIEPGLDIDARIRAGVHLPEALCGNPRQLAQQLRAACQKRGVRFHLRRQVDGLHPGRAPTLSHRAIADDERAGPFAAFAPRPANRPAEARQDRYDRIVVCAGIDARGLLDAAGLRLPLLPVWGASVTAPVRQIDAHPDLGPRGAVIDWRSGASLSRLGLRLRASTGGRLTGLTTRPDGAEEARLEARVYASLDRWFPGSYETAKAQRWIGCRPSLPDGLPAVGASTLDGIWLHLGHGALGWGLAPATSRLLADALAERTPARPMSPLDAGRFA